MPITAIPGSPLYEEMVRRSMVNAQSGTPAVVNSDAAAYNPIMAPNYADWSKMAAYTGQNYGIVDRMLGVDPSMAAAYSGQAYGGSGGGGAGGAGGYGGIDPALLAAMNADYDRSRLGMMGAERAYEKRLRGDFNERFGGAETGLLGRAEQTSRDQMSGQLAGLEQQRNLALAQARERAEERALRAKEAEQARRDRQLAAANSAYSQSSYGSGAGGYGSAGQYTQSQSLGTGGKFGANFVGGGGGSSGGKTGGTSGGSSGGTSGGDSGGGGQSYYDFMQGGGAQMGGTEVPNDPNDALPPPIPGGGEFAKQDYGPYGAGYPSVFNQGVTPQPTYSGGQMNLGASGMYAPQIGSAYDPRVANKASASFGGGMTGYSGSY